MIDKRLLAEAQALEAEIARRKLEQRINDPVHFATTIGYPPDPWQQRVLRFAGKELVMLCARQAGKSTITGILALHRAISVANALILIVSPSQRQSTEMLLKVKAAMLGMPAPPRLEQDNTLSITFENRSRIVSLPANEQTVRGFSAVNLLIEDEAADVPDSLNTAIRPMLAVSGGQLIIMGTPKGRQGHFFEAYENGGEAWDRIKVTADQIVRYDPSFLVRAREDLYARGLGDMYRQEYECEFVSAAAGRVYNAFDEARNCLDVLPPVRSPEEWTYLCGLDFGIQDQNAVTVLGWRAHDPVVYVIESYRKTAIPSEMAEEVKRLDAVYHFERIVGDIGGMGKAFAEEARRRFRVPIEPAEKHNKIGFIALLNGELQMGRLQLHKAKCRELIGEWRELAWEEGGKREAEGKPNHAADSCLYAWRACVAFLEEARVTIDRASPEWRAQEQAEMLARDIEKQERLREGDWWEQMN